MAAVLARTALASLESTADDGSLGITATHRATTLLARTALAGLESTALNRRRLAALHTTTATRRTTRTAFAGLESTARESERADLTPLNRDGITAVHAAAVRLGLALTTTFHFV